MLPARPWYLAIVAVWERAEGFEPLRAALLDALGLVDMLPSHQPLLRRGAWHSTLFALLQINSWDNHVQTGEEYSRALLQRLHREHDDIVPRLAQVLSPIEVEVSEVVCYDSATSVHVKAVSEALRTFRMEAQDILLKPVVAVCHKENDTGYARGWNAEHGRKMLEPLLLDPSKNSGSRSYCSVARSTYPGDSPVLRWRRPLPPLTLIFRELALISLDAAMTNPGPLEGAILLRPPG